MGVSIIVPMITSPEEGRWRKGMGIIWTSSEVLILRKADRELKIEGSTTSDWVRLKTGNFASDLISRKSDKRSARL